MKIYTLEQKQFLPLSLSDAWKFFSNPHNLKNITPPELGFHVLSNVPDAIYAGMIVEYTVRPMFNIPIHWTTEITHVREPFLFVDEQRFGPYKFWHHQHLFSEVDGGVEMRDIINYALPLGFIGSLTRELVVRRQLEHIFNYRRSVLDKLFPAQ